MPDYSDTTKGLFENVRLHNVRVMLDLLSESDLREKEYLRRRYTERAPNFDATLAFLKHTDIVDEHEKVLQPTRNGRVAELRGEALPQVLLQRLVGDNSPFRAQVLTYLRQFRIVHDTAAHRPTTEQKSAESELRNFFMELGVVSYDNVNGQYVLAFDHFSLYLLAVRSVSPVRPSDVQRRRKDKEDLGFAAELEILGFERERVGMRFAERVHHVAVTDAAAGYDIESVTVRAEDQLLPRFIEVKAVSPEDYRFFWTANEVAIARSLRSWYYLYLLPTNGRGSFIIDMLRIICDPEVAVLKRRHQWSVEGNVLECKMTSN